ncbi:hypothetical protein HYU20_00505 [Candidatus Woesearchaeota archaeon]|nr:hypothetical protein [Candidatus Woesearchaeota archaeon]
MIRLLKSKKGQFYILIALLLISYAFQLARQDVPIRKQKDAFQVLHEGYIDEGANVINNAVYEDLNVTARFKSFTDDYVAFAKSAEPSFGLAYLLKQKDALTIGNRLAANLNVTAGGASFLVSPNSERSVSAGNATLLVSGISYDFGFSGGDIQLKALFRASDKLTTRVFVRG